MKIATKDLTGRQLDWVVTKIELDRRVSAGEHVKGWVKDEVEAGIRSDPYSTDWLWGGPIIERERINVGESVHPTTDWTATLYVPDEEAWQFDAPTPLIAAMRCFVASKLGHEVELPEGLEP